MAFERGLSADDRSGSRDLPEAVELVARRRSPAPDRSFVPLPEPVGARPFRLTLEDVVGSGPIAEIERAGSLRFHALGDSGGDIDPLPQRRVVAALVSQLDDPEPARFLYHLGDVVYPHGEESGYRSQFHLPYASYRAPILGVPGNHDADRKAIPGVTTLDPWLARFCSRLAPLHDAAAAPPRPLSRQPNVYWTLVCPWLRIIGLYTNVPEGGQIAEDQLDWLVGELRASPPDTITILAMHQPVYSADITHGSNLALVELLDRCVARAGRRPDLVISGHAHSYQRYMRRVDGRAIPHLVAGAGGYHELHPLGRGIERLPMRFDAVAGLEDVTLDAYEDRAHGFLSASVSPGVAQLRYHAVSSTDVVVRDAFAVHAPAG